MNQLHRRTAINEAVEVLPTPGVPVSRIFGRFLCGPSSLIGKKEGGVCSFSLHVRSVLPDCSVALENVVRYPSCVVFFLPLSRSIGVAVETCDVVWLVLWF